MTTTSDAPPATYAGVVPYIHVRDAREAIAWYREAFGAKPRGVPYVGDDGSVGHAEIEVAGAVVMLSDSAYPGLRVPGAGEPVTFSLVLTVPDVDATADQAVAAGATLERAPQDNPYGRNAVVRDPFGERWMLQEAAAPAATSATEPARRAGGASELRRQGDLAYATLVVRDVNRAAAFFERVLGWSYGTDGSDDYRRIEGLSFPHDIMRGEVPTLYCCYEVDDAATAVETVRAAAGQAGEMVEEYGGRSAACRDDQGTAFALYQSLGRRPLRRRSGGARPGDLVYVTMRVTDSARARAFYGAVLDWRFIEWPGDGWEARDAQPTQDLIGGHEAPVAIPTYHVRDIVAAIAEIRSAGGSAPDPVRTDYGLTQLDCVDDQGTRFGLNQP